MAAVYPAGPLPMMAMSKMVSGKVVLLTKNR
jgi:hypothetical protein